MVDFFAGVTVLIWLYLLLGRGMFWRLRDADQGQLPHPAARRVAIVIPARNEAAVVGRTIASLAGQDYGGPFHIFLVDDDRQDDTAESALQAARETGKPGLVTVTRARPLPEGWSGKMWALAEGVREAGIFHPDYLLFSDADIVHSPGNLATLVALAETGGYDLVSFMVKLECETFAERALIPAFVFFFFKLYPPAWTASGRHATAGAAGGCILMHSAALARSGGIPAIRGELIDDCALARAVKSTGGRLWLGVTAKTTSIRRYGTFGEIGSMISRFAFWQLHHSTLLLVGAIAGMFVTYLLPPLLLLTARPLAAAAGGFAWLLMMSAYAPVLRLYRLSVAWAPFLPLVALFYLGATVHSAVRYWSGHGGAWKGRVQDPRRVS